MLKKLITFERNKEQKSLPRINTAVELHVKEGQRMALKRKLKMLEENYGGSIL